MDFIKIDTTTAGVSVFVTEAHYPQLAAVITELNAMDDVTNVAIVFDAGAFTPAEVASTVAALAARHSTLALVGILGDNYEPASALPGQLALA